MSLYFALQTVENNKNKKSVKFQGDMLNFCDFIQVFVFTRNHHLKYFHDSKANQAKYLTSLDVVFNDADVKSHYEFSNSERQ